MWFLFWNIQKEHLYQIFLVVVQQTTYKIARMPPTRRIAMLVAFVRSCEVSALDDALDVLDGVIADIGRAAKKIG